MFKINRKIWGVRVRKTLIVALIAPLFTVISASIPQVASAAFQSASDGTCTQDVGSTTGVTVTAIGRDCIITFTNTTANSWVVPTNGADFQILVVGGGGGGGADGGNGGGGGELRYSSASPSWIPAAGTTLSIQVGAGGAPATAGSASTVAWGGSTRYQANGGSGGGGWQSTVVPTGGTGGTGGTGTNGQNATATPPNNVCSGTASARQEPSSSSWYSTRWFFNGGGAAGAALTTTAPTNSITGSSKFYGGAGGAGWGANINSASIGPIFGLAGGGTVDNTSTSGGRGANWQYEAGESTTYRAGASVGGNGVNGTGGGGGGGNACDPTINGAAVTNLVYKRTSGGSGGNGSVTIRYTSVFTVTFNANNGSGSPSVSTATQTVASNTVTLATAGTLTRNGFRFSGWNTLANGSGQYYAAGSSFTPSSDVTLYAQWSSVINYNGNSSTSTRVIESTTAIGTSSNATLSTGRLIRGNPISSGLILNLDAADSSTVSGATWTNKVSGGTNATIVGSPTYSASEGAFTLNGSSQYFDLGSSAFNFSGTQNYTINVAFKNNEPMKDSSLIARYNGNVAGNYYLINSSGKYYTTREVSPWGISSNSYVDPSQVNYVSAVFNGSSLTVFVNGVSDGSIAMTGSVGNNSIKTLIGARLTSGSAVTHLNGKIYSVQIYDRALSATEIQTNYQELVPEARVSKNNFTLAGWTTAPSSGATVAGNLTDLTALPTPYLRLLPQNYNAATKVWTATNGSGAGFTYTGSPTYNANGGGGYGAANIFPVISGGTSAGIRLNNPTLTTYTLCVVARYKNAADGTAGSQGRLINSSNSNWISGFYNGLIRQFHHEAWNYDGGTTDLNWHYYCDSGNKAIWDGVKTPTWTYRSTTSLPPLAINWDPYSQNSDWELAEMIVYDQFLSDSSIDNLSRYFKNRYGILNGSASSVAAGGIAAVTNYTSAGDTTLYANWGSTITYEGNGQTSGTPPSAQIITGTSGTLASNTGSLAKAGFRFDGWNTAANGSGTFYAAGGTYPNTGNVILYAQYSKKLVFPSEYSSVDPLRLSPYMRFKAEDYNTTTKSWIDSSGNNRSTSMISGTPSVITSSLGNGNTKTFKVVSGSTAERIRFNNPQFSNGNFTFITVARYSGAAKARIFDSVGYNWLHGFWSGSAGVAYHEGWVTATSSVVHGNNWVIGASFEYNYRSNGTSRGSSGGVNYMPPMSINYGNYPAERSDFEVAEVLIFDYKLSATQLAQVENYLAQSYGVSLASPATYPSSSNVAIGAGVGGRSETLTAVEGRGAKSFSMSPTRPGFTLDTSTANSVALVVSPTVATGSYAQTIIATEGNGETATYLLNVTVSPSAKFDTSTATTLNTTYRRGASLRLNTVFGVGTKVFTMTPAGTGITLDTTTASSGYATLRVDTYTAVGTYTQVITVTDDTKIRSTYTVTIMVNGPPTISSTSAITNTPVTTGLRLNLDAGDTASYSGSGNSWTDLSGKGVNATWQVAPSFSTSNGGTFDLNGSSQYATTSSIPLQVFTVEVWAKLNALNTGYACLVSNVYTGDKINYSICFRGNSTIAAAYHQSGTGWIGGQTGAFTPVVGTWYQLVYTVAKVGANYVGTLYVNNSALSQTTSSTIAPGSDPAGLRIGRRWDTGEYINGSIPVVRIYDRALSAAEISQNYSALLPRFANNPSNSVTITTTESITASSSIYYAGLGTGTKTFALSNPTTGISIDTATVNTVRLNVANTLTATSTTVFRSISQVISATDSTGLAAATPVYVTTVINPKVIISASIPQTLTTTFGKTAYDTFTATQGTGTKTFTVTSATYSSAFVMTNPSSNVGLLTVASNLPAGTYPVTVTATDSVSATTTYSLSVVVNPVPTIAGATGNTLDTTVTRAATLRINVTGGSGTRLLSWTSPHSGITLDSSTITSNYATLNVSASVPSRTYSFAITVTDSTTARATETFTVTVNKWPVIATPSIVTSGLKISLDAGNSSSYSGSGTTWTDLSGNGKNGTWQQSPTFNSASGGSIAMGSTTSQYMSSAALGAMPTFTAEVWVKFNAIPTSNNCILTDKYTTSGISLSLCFRNDQKIYGGYWRSDVWYLTAGTAIPSINTWYHFAYTVSLSGGTYTYVLYQNGVPVGSPLTNTVAPTSGNTGFLVGTNWNANTTVVNGDIAVVRVYDKALTASEVSQNYNAQGLRFTSTNSGSDTATVTQGVAGSVTGVSAAEGTGTKSFALSGASTGISLSNPSSNSFTLTLPDTLTAASTTTARTITETVTATDQAGATTSRIYTITVNPPVIETATSTSIATTSGVETTTVIYATQGTGNKTFALSGATSGFTLTSGVNQATLKVLSTANPGTYNLSVTATDSLGAATSLPITVVVSPPPTLVGISRIESTKGVAFTSPVYTLSGGTGTLSMTISNSPTNSNITLTGVTSTGGYILVGSNSETGTYQSTIRVTDARGSYSELIVTVVVNAPVTLSGSLSITKTYGNSVSSGYSTNGSGTAPFSFSATPICAVVKTVSGSYTYERINGTDSCTWTAPVGVTTIDALIVGAGGGGGGDGGSGGGGGSINTLSSVTLPANRQLTVQVGSGGTGSGWGGPDSTAGGTTTLTSGSTSYTAPGGAAGGGCGSAAVSGGSLGSGGTAVVGGSSGYGATGTNCAAGTGSNGSNGPVSNFTGSDVSYGGGGGGGLLPGTTTAVGPTSGGNGGGGAGAISRAYPSYGLTQYFRAKPVGATNGDVFTTGTCADPIVGNINFRSDSYFPCTSQDNFQGYATGYFVAPVSGSITFYLTSDDASKLVINVSGTNNTLELTPCCKTVEATWSGFVAGQAYPIDAFFTEDAGNATWILEYAYTGFTRSIIPISQFRSTAEGLAQYFSTASTAAASSKTAFTTSSSTCMERVGNINYSTNSQFPCASGATFQGYATGYFIAPYTGSITFTLTSDDSSHLTINVNGVNNELTRACCGEASATWSGFVKGQYYPINVYFTENGGLALWKLEYAFTGVSKTIIPVTYLRSTASFTLPVQGTNGLGGGGGGGSAGTFKLNGASGGSGTAILKYLTPSETATQTMITAIVNQQTPSGLLTLNVPEYVNVGTYTQTIKVQDAANSAPYQAVVTITINKATPTLALSLPGSVTTAKYGNPVTVSAVTTTPGRVAFLNGSDTITACSSVATIAGLATCSWTPNAVGSTTLKATLTPTDTANYNSSALVSLPITVAKADTLTVTVTSLTRQYTGSAVSVTGGFTTTGLVAIDSLTAISMLYSGTANTGTSRSATTAPTDAGIYTITPNYPANTSAYTFVAGSMGTTSAVSNYESITVVAGTLTINRAPQVISFRYPDTNTATYSPNGTITPTAITRLDSAVRSYSSSTLTKCTIDSATAVISIVEAGACQVSMAVAQTANYLADTATVTVTINKAARTFSLTPAVSTLKYADSTTVTATLSAGASDGTISYTLGSPAGCTFDPLTGELIAISGTIQCPLTATISEGINYLAETATAISLTIARANAPVITIDTITAMNYTPGIRALVMPNFSVTGLKNSETADSLTYTYSFVSNPFETFTYSDTRTPIDAGTYRITPSALTLSTGLMSNYETPTYSSSAIDFVINRIAQETVTIVTTNGEVDVPFTLQASGGSTNGAVSFTKLSGASCSVTGNSLSATASGLCILSVTRAGDRNYLPFTSESITVMVRNYVIYQVVVPTNPNTGITITPTTPTVKGPDSCTSGCVPTLTSADVYDVAEGDLIILTGTNLLSVTKVYFNIYTEAPNFTANSETELAVRVPADLPQGDATIEVVSPGGTSNRLFDFIILP